MMRTPLVLALFLCVLTGCGSTQEMDRSTRETDGSTQETAPVDTSEVPTGKWDLSDARPVAASIANMTSEMLEGRVVQGWTNDHERSPTVVVFIENATSLHHDHEIDRDTTASYVTQKLRTADKVQVAPEIRREIRRELAGGHSMCCQKTPFSHAVEIAQAANADFMVHGEIDGTIKEERRGEEGSTYLPIVYTFGLQLLELEKYERHFQREKKVKKFVLERCVGQVKDPSC